MKQDIFYAIVTDGKHFAVKRQVTTFRWHSTESRFEYLVHYPTIKDCRWTSDPLHHWCWHDEPTAKALLNRAMGGVRCDG